MRGISHGPLIGRPLQHQGPLDVYLVSAHHVVVVPPPAPLGEGHTHAVVDVGVVAEVANVLGHAQHGSMGVIFKTAFINMDYLNIMITSSAL